MSYIYVREQGLETTYDGARGKAVTRHEEIILEISILTLGVGKFCAR